MMNPMQILAQVMPRARSEEELVSLASQLGAPPPVDFRPPATPMTPPGGVARFQGMPQSPLVPGAQKPQFVPPMTQGESRTSNFGQHLVGGGGY